MIFLEVVNNLVAWDVDVGDDRRVFSLALISSRNSRAFSRSFSAGEFVSLSSWMDDNIASIVAPLPLSSSLTAQRTKEVGAASQEDAPTAVVTAGDKCVATKALASLTQKTTTKKADNKNGRIVGFAR